MLNTIYVKTGHIYNWFDSHLVQGKKPKWLRLCLILQGHNQVGIKIFWYEFVKHVLYFEESAAALNEFKYFCLNHVYNAAWWGFTW